MKLFERGGIFLFCVLALGACSDLASEVSGSCGGTQTVAGMTVNMCTESPTLTLSNQGTLNTLCRSGTFGASANNWYNGVACGRAGRVGGCRRVVSGVDVVSWIYPNGTAVNAAAVQQFCAQIMATYQAP